jgi:hypothetical protein
MGVSNDQIYVKVNFIPHYFLFQIYVKKMDTLQLRL